MRGVRVLIGLLLIVAPSVSRAQAAPSRATVTDERTNVRAEPSIDASIVTAFGKGQVVDVVEVREGWTKVSASGKTGWIRSAALSANAQATTLASEPRRPSSPSASSRNDASQSPAPNAPSPSNSTKGFEVGYTGLGPVIGVGGLGGASIAFGGRYEHAIKELPGLGDGILGFSLDADYYSYSTQFIGGGVSWHYLPIGAAANYHFKLDDRKWDPFLGLGLGYAIASVSGGGTTYTANSGLYFIGRAGVRYFYADKVAFQLDAGAGAATLSFGVIFRM